MRPLIFAACLILSVSILGGIRSASADPTTPATQPTTRPVAVNKLCPVTKEAVDPKIPTVEYKGKTIGFCCDDCIKEFKADPEKYMKDLK